MLDRNSPFIPQSTSSGTNLADLAHRLLTAAIIEGDPAPGSVLSEASISTRFGVGLAATRTVLARLSAMSWVEARNRSGWVVQPISPAHLADLQSARRWLEPALPGSPCTRPLSDELCRQADIHESAAHLPADTVLLHQERKLLALTAQAVAAPRLRRWLTDTWDLSLRADHFFNRTMGIARTPLPLSDLSRAVAHTDSGATARILDTMRAEFEARIAHALSHGDGPISGDPAPATRQAAAGTSHIPTHQGKSLHKKGDGA